MRRSCSNEPVMYVSSPEIRKEAVFGTLYVVSTPIGNLEDITLRALRILKEVDVIAAEGVEHTRGLLRHYGITTRVETYNQHNHMARAPELVTRLKSGKNIAIVTDAGTPGISDPGVHLINMAAGEDINVTPIPGPSAVAAAISVSGMPCEQFVFLGFLPNRAGKRREALKRVASEIRTMVFFEAPHRIKPMLKDLVEILGDRPMVMLREITKVFEEIRRGAVSSVLNHLTENKIRGEFTLVVAGSGGEKLDFLSESVLERVKYLLADEDRGIKDIAELISREEGVSYRQIYKECIAIREGNKKSPMV